MKKQLLLSFAAALSLCAAAQGTIVLNTSAPAGTQVRFLPNVKSATAPLRVDFGNGEAVPFTINPSMPAYQRWVEGTVEGGTITITGDLTSLSFNEAELTSAKVEGMTNLTELDLQNNAITSFTLADATPLVTLDLSGNQLSNSTEVNPTLSLEKAGATLQNLDLSDNSSLVCLDMRHLAALRNLTVSDCPMFASVFICAPEETHAALTTINLSNCQLSHFYPISMPSLTMLDLSNNQLDTASDIDPFVLGDYPLLRTLSVAGNASVDKLDISACTKLESIDVTGCSLTELANSFCPELRVLNAADNLIPSLDLSANKALTTVNVSGNPIKELDLKPLTNLRFLNISDTQISRVDLMYTYFLQTFEAASTLLEFVDFNGVQPGGLSKIDLRYNTRMTGESVDYTIHTLPVARENYSTDNNLLLRGSNGETADISYATSSDMLWKCDIAGDNTASHTPLPLTLVDATDTGENVTGTLERLYPNFGLSLDYDLDRYTTAGGDFLISQWQQPYYQKIAAVNGQALPGVPVHIYPYPAEGKRFRSVTVNGKEIFSQWFMITEPSEVKVNFVNEESSLSFTTTPGQPLSFLVNTTGDDGTVEVDWGTGSRQAYEGQRAYISGSYEIKGARIDGTAAGETVTVYGDLAAIDLSGYGDMAELLGLHDNKVTAVNLTNAPDLRFLSLYWNPVGSIDLTPVTGLEFLNVAYTNLKTLDLSHTPELMWLEAFSDGFGFEEDGISMLDAIDVTPLHNLRYLDVKANSLSSIDLTGCPELVYAYLGSNRLTSVDLTHNTLLRELNVADNQLTSIDISKNPDLEVLSVDGNSLTSIDLSANSGLTQLSVANNAITELDTHHLSMLRRLYINGNGLSADELNDIYYMLPERYPDTPEESDPSVGQVSYNLAVQQGGDKTPNEGTRADSSIAVHRGWTPSHQGANGGSDVAYLDITTNNVEGCGVTVTDSEGNTYAHGSKVPKYTPLTITPTVAPGYSMKHFTLNGEEPREGTSFDMPGLYTRLYVEFSDGDGVESVTASTGASVRSGAGCVMVETPQAATVDIFTADGRHVASLSAAEGSTVIPVDSGIYMVRVATATGTAAVSVAVR